MKRPLALLAVSSLLPVVVLAAAYAALSLQRQRAAIEAQARSQAQYIGVLIGRELAAQRRSLQMIAQSPFFDQGVDRERFRTLGLRLLRDEPIWRTLSVSDPAGNREYDVPAPIGGQPGGKVVDLASHRRTVIEKRAVVGGIVRGPQNHDAFAVRAPILRDNRVAFVVSAVVEPTALSGLLLPRNSPDGWSVTVLDQQGRVVATTDRGAAEIAAPAPAPLLQALAEPAGGFHRGRTPAGAELIATWSEAADSGWRVAVALPARAYDAPLLQASQVLALGALASILLTLVLSRLLVRELDQQRRRQIAVLEAQRLEALGRMTGGVAHDFNNLLTPIIGGMDLLHRRLAHDPRAQAVLEGALASAERARTLVSRLLAFARRQTLEPQDVDVGKLLAGLVELLERSIGPDVKLVLDLPPALPSASVDPAQLELAVLNLAVNARDAMPAGGTLTLAAAVEEVARAHDGLRPGRYVAVSVKDTGVGMDEATLRRAAEPFFTTKDVGKGTGLGLSMVDGLAAQSGGALWISSRPGAGTTVRILLPVGAGQAAPPAPAEPVATHRLGRLLLVDDEPLVRGSTAALLREHGHEVVEAESVQQALAALREDAGLDLLITDYAMPVRSGAELIREAKAIRPALPVLLITGFENAAVELPADVARLGKPFRQNELLSRVGSLLARAEPGASAA